MNDRPNSIRTAPAVQVTEMDWEKRRDRLRSVGLSEADIEDILNPPRRLEVIDWRQAGKVLSALLMIGAAAAGALQLANVPGFQLSPGATVAVLVYLATVPVATGFLPAPKPDSDLPPRG